MNLLAIDTSGRRGSVAVAQVHGADCRVLSQAALPASPRTAQTLLPAIRDQLATVDWSVSDLTAIAVTSGPGSFTGLRLGIVTAKTLAYASGAQLAAVPTLAALAAGRDAARRPVWAVLDAQRDEAFAARFTAEPNVAALPEVQLAAIDALAGLLQSGEALATPQATLAKIAERLPAGVEAIDGIDDGPSPAAVAQLGAALIAAGHTVDPLQLVPQYHRRSAAEEKAAASASQG